MTAAKAKDLITDSRQSLLFGTMVVLTCSWLVILLSDRVILMHPHVM